MLNSMRTLSKSIVSKLLMLLLVISFGVWGVGDILRSNGPGYAAKVGGETISRAEFEQQRALVKGQLETLGMNDIPASKLALTVIRQLIMQKLTLMAMQDMGLVVNDALVSKMIADIPEFKNKDGKFDAKLFKRMLDNNRMSEQGFIAQLKRDIAGRFLTDSLSMHDSPAPASVIALAATIDGETRDAVLLTVPTKGAAKESDEAALKAYYDANKQFSYMLPEARTLEYVVLADTEINELVGKSITKEMVDEKLKQSPEMNEGLARMKLSAEQREDVLHTLGNTIEDELAGGKNMGEAFAKAGISVIPRVITDATPALAKSSDDDVTRTVAEQGFGLSEGEISRLISTKKGTLLMVSAKKITPAAPKPYEAVQDDVRMQLAKQLSRDAAREKAVTVKAELAKAPNWEAVAQAQGLYSRAVSRVARPTDGKASGGISLALQQAIFEKAVGEVAGPVTLENGDQLLALVTQSHLPTIDPTALVPTRSLAKMVDNLGRDIEARAFHSFSEGHKVDINPSLMGDAATSEE